MGERTDGHAGGRASAAVIVAGVISEAGARRKDGRFAALHPAVNDGSGLARNLRVARGPERMLAAAGRPRSGPRAAVTSLQDHRKIFRILRHSSKIIERSFGSCDIPPGSLKDLSDLATFLQDL